MLHPGKKGLSFWACCKKARLHRLGPRPIGELLLQFFCVPANNFCCNLWYSSRKYVPCIYRTIILWRQRGWCRKVSTWIWKNTRNQCEERLRLCGTYVRDPHVLMSRSLVSLMSFLNSFLVLTCFLNFWTRRNSTILETQKMLLMNSMAGNFLGKGIDEI